MKLLTHNLLKSPVKGVQSGYPLNIEAQEIQVEQNEFNEEFIRRLWPRINYQALLQATRQIGFSELAENVPEPLTTEFLQKAHHALNNLNVFSGALVCPESGRKFQINRGIPNMLLREDEV
eukprot:TRINITY_DN626_c2_g1_i1.p1 TRINITY_DN626_c2_g1~~TRINITY_DN626_c2_g1_i1.p1  ORF type:complete len:121 (-),score=54.98 TRINITY_DN626_c2_g1_i1:135-497(-)